MIFFGVCAIRPWCHEPACDVASRRDFLSYLGPVWGSLSQWRIRDFPDGGANSQSGCADLFFAKYCMKMKEFGRGGRVPGAPLDPPMLVDSLNSTMTQLLCQRKEEHLERFISPLSLSTTQKFIIIWLQMSHWQLQCLLMSCFHFSGFFCSFILCRFPLKL